MAEAMVIVSTCPRPGADYLPETLQALDRVGAADLPKMVLSDGPLPQPCRWPARVRTPAARSSRANLWDAFRIAVDARVERLLYFEDDVIPCRNAVTRMLAVRCPPEAGLLSFHDKKRGLRSSQGLHVVSARDSDGYGFWGLQAVVLPRCTLTYLAAKDPYSIWTRNTSRHGDRVVEQFVAASPWPKVAHHIPSLVRHVGTVSVAHPDRRWPNRHVPDTYVGDDFDALTLPAFEGAVKRR
jgi:hypothetical protein